MAEEKTIKLPAYLGEPDMVILEKVAGKIGEYRVVKGLPFCIDCGDCGKCWCGVMPPEIKDLDGKVNKLTDIVNTKFGEINKILNALKK